MNFRFNRFVSLRRHMGILVAILMLLTAIVLTAAASSDGAAEPENFLLAVASGSTTLGIAAVPEKENASNYQEKYRYVRCNSTLLRRRTCQTWGKNPVKLWRRHSASGCVKRQDWNTTNKGQFVWVDNGCQATFRVRTR